ncbi:hypothetical protein GL273_05330 [Aeromonas jandaei]|uniref:hypothetical protein n=1 Tax=Aeromonas jandaei TaxID=650 RepID=UPI001C5BC24A|nr:hypothetical protein [Aeromonas jandaei]MBW3805249.1 hypothetical protein [Aeromonas jandaei]
MSKNNPLEVASWIAGISGVLLTGYFQFFPNTSDKDNLVSVDEPKISENRVQEAKFSNIESAPQGDVKSSRGSGLDSMDRSTCKDVKILENKFSLARTLSTYDKRDSVYTQLIDDYLCNKNHDSALKIAEQLSTYEKRDDNYMKILKSLVLSGDVEEAIKISSKMSTYDKRDEAKKYIISGL